MNALFLAAVLASGYELPGPDSLKIAFNAAKGNVRVVMLVSPT